MWLKTPSPAQLKLCSWPLHVTNLRHHLYFPDIFERLNFISLNLTVVPGVQGTYSPSLRATEMLSGETCGCVVRWGDPGLKSGLTMSLSVLIY